jgi:5'-nucleotidase
MSECGFYEALLEIVVIRDRLQRRSIRGLVFRWTLLALTLVLAAAWPSHVVAQDSGWPRRVLITNDNGIDDVATRALAQAFAGIADAVLVAPTEDRSGASNLMTFTRTGRFVVERREIGEGVRAWALDGYPADCVVFALAGPMADALPDLVVSGINGGANMADEWFGSGTIGAARTAAFAGIPAMAVSGIDRSDPEAMAAVVDWVLRLARSEIMQRVRPPSYLTVSLPAVPPGQITGIEVVDRARGILGVVAQLDRTAGRGAGKEVWSAEMAVRGQPNSESDVGAVGRGHIAVVPMRVGDADPELLAWLRINAGQLPAWRAIRRDR